MAILIPTAQTIDRIYAAYRNDAPRAHLGASVIGHPCERHLWYTFRFCTKPNFSGRMLRLFERGRQEEPHFIADLRAAGVEVYDRDPETGEQFRFSDCDSHLGGSMDACGRGFIEAPSAWHVIEFKTHSRKSFAELTARGVAGAKPQHAAQVQCYMGWSGMRRAFYLAVNKDTDELYQERLNFDKGQFEALREKARRIITANLPPPRISDRPGNFPCKYCDHQSVCFYAVTADQNCRTCKHARPVAAGCWHCAHHDHLLDKDAQMAGCSEYALIPALLTWEAEGRTPRCTNSKPSTPVLENAQEIDR